MDTDITPSARRRARERVRIRDRILDAAREVFATEGYEAVTMRRIADSIEYTAPVIYQHFADKATLIRELVLQDFRLFARSFQVLANVADPVERIRAMGMAYVEFGLTHPHHYRVMFMTTLPSEINAANIDPDGQGNPETDSYAFLRRATDDAFRAGRFNPDLTDPIVIAQVLWQSLHGIVALEIAWPREKWSEYVDPRLKARVACEALMVGLTCHAASSRA